MPQFIRCFVRTGPGTWRCISPAYIDLPGGRIEVAIGCVVKKGRKFMNVDLAALLERQDEEEHHHHP